MLSQNPISVTTPNKIINTTRSEIKYYYKFYNKNYFNLKKYYLGHSAGVATGFYGKLFNRLGYDP